MKTITHTSTLVEYDSPQVFEASDTQGQRYLGLAIPSPDAPEDRCLIVAVTNETLRGFRDGRSDLRSVVLDGADDAWYVARRCPGLGQAVEIEEQSDPLPEQYLPDADLLLPAA